jgi:dihydroneopterin aldolase
MRRGQDILRLHGLRLSCRLGVTAAERRRPQPVRADIVLHGDWRCAAEHDRLEDTVDYAALAADLRRELGRRPFQLLEALAEALAAVCLRDPRVAAVEVQVAKRPPASVKGLARFEVCVFRTRPRRVRQTPSNRNPV